MGRFGMLFSVVALAAGAVMYWAVTDHSTGFRVSTVGLILMIVGAVGLISSFTVFGVSQRAGRVAHTLDHQVVGVDGTTTSSHEESR